MPGNVTPDVSALVPAAEHLGGQLPVNVSVHGGDAVEGVVEGHPELLGELRPCPKPEFVAGRVRGPHARAYENLARKLGYGIL